MVLQRGSKNPDPTGKGNGEAGGRDSAEIFVSSDDTLNLGVKTAFFQAVQKWKAGPLMDKMERKVTFRLPSQVELCLILILARGN